MSIRTDPATSARMARVRRRDTNPELIVRRWLTARGVRYRVQGAGLPGSPDLVNRTRNWALFVHGCFWHGHEGCKASKIPTRNRQFWREKIRSNVRRDAQKEASLSELGFDVHVVWECEVKVLARGGPVPVQLALLVRRQRSRPSASR